MANSSLILISPKIAPTNKSEAELFGAMVWLWMQSETHRDCPLQVLNRLLLPAIKTGQFVLALQNHPLQQPVGLFTWACLTAEAEQRYLQTLDETIQPSDWQQGDRPWLLDLVVPFGHIRDMTTAVRQALPTISLRFLYHRGHETGLKVKYFKGNGITKADEADFWASRPLPTRVSK